jgi:hypothetical protein
MKDFYWDLRPKPEYGTIELRVCDTPLSVERAAALACYLQALCRYLLEGNEPPPREDDYLVYNYNRFQACRFGLDGVITHPKTYEQLPLRDDILATLDLMEPHAQALGSVEALLHLARRRRTAAIRAFLRAQYERQGSCEGMVERGDPALPRRAADGLASWLGLNVACRIRWSSVRRTIRGSSSAPTILEETMSTNTVELHRVLKSNADRVYRAFLTAGAFAKWLPPHGFIGTVHEMDAQGRRPLPDVLHEFHDRPATRSAANTWNWNRASASLHGRIRRSRTCPAACRPR